MPRVSEDIKDIEPTTDDGTDDTGEEAAAEQEAQASDKGHPNGEAPRKPAPKPAGGGKARPSAPAGGGKGGGKGKPSAAAEDREVVHGKLAVYVCDSVPPNKPITVDKAKAFLGFMWEDQYVARMKQRRPDQHEEVSKADFAARVLCVDMAGRKVVCLNNDHNRPYDEPRTLRYMQDLGNRKWSGPLMDAPGVPAEEKTVNGETLIIGRQGQIISGQKRLLALIFLDQVLKGEGSVDDRRYSVEQQRHWRKMWAGQEPVLESILVLGASEAQAIVDTVEDVQPRSAADVLYTGEWFRARPGIDPATKKAGRVPCSPKERGVLSKMLSSAVDLLWGRLGMRKSEVHGQRTNSEVTAFVRAHPHVVEAVEHIWAENQERALGFLHLNVGTCAGLLYLMGTSGSDGAAYRKKEPRSEKHLDFSMWPKALEFWVQLAIKTTAHLPVNRSAPMAVVHKEIHSYNKDEEGGPHSVEKAAIIVKAWARWQAGEDIVESDLLVTYRPDPDAPGGRKIDWAELPKLSGIDVGEPHKASMSPEGEGPEAAVLEGEGAADEAIAETKAQKRARIEEETKTAALAAKGGTSAAAGKETPVLKTRRQLTEEAAERKRIADKEAEKAIEKAKRAVKG